MSFNPDIAAVRARIAEAQAERAAGQAAGSERRYIAACFRLQALERGPVPGKRRHGKASSKLAASRALTAASSPEASITRKRRGCSRARRR